MDLFSEYLDQASSKSDLRKAAQDLQQSKPEESEPSIMEEIFRKAQGEQSFKVEGVQRSAKKGKVAPYREEQRSPDSFVCASLTTEEPVRRSSLIVGSKISQREMSRIEEHGCDASQRTPPPFSSKQPLLRTIDLGADQSQVQTPSPAHSSPFSLRSTHSQQGQGRGFKAVESTQHVEINLQTLIKIYTLLDGMNVKFCDCQRDYFELMAGPATQEQLNQAMQVPSNQ